MALCLISFLLMLTMVWCTTPPSLDFNIERMAGRFYLVYVESRLGSSAFFMNNTFCHTQDYIKLNETSLSFYRYHNKGIPSATPEGEYRGTFTKTDTGTLQYKPVDQSFKSESYLIKIGGDTCSSENDQYDYYINTRDNLFWVKVKDVEMFQEVYKPEIDAFLEEYGYSILALPHNSSCNYPDPPEDFEENAIPK